MVYASLQAARAALPWFNLLGLTQLSLIPVFGFVLLLEWGCGIILFDLSLRVLGLCLGLNMSSCTVDCSNWILCRYSCVLQWLFYQTLLGSKLSLYCLNAYFWPSCLRIVSALYLLNLYYYHL